MADRWDRTDWYDPNPTRHRERTNKYRFSDRRRERESQAVDEAATTTLRSRDPPEDLVVVNDPSSDSHVTELTDETTTHALNANRSTINAEGYHLAAAAAAAVPRRHRYDGDVRPPSGKYREKLKKWYKKRFPAVSESESESERTGDDVTYDRSLSRTTTTESTMDGSVVKGISLLDQDDDYLNTTQSVAWLSITVTSVQLLVLMLQLAMCGIAGFDINPMIGPFPDAFSLWGGKNAYLMLHDDQWWRLITPAFLHVGIAHLLINAFCQLQAIALFEREWGSARWLIIFLISTFGCQACSCFFDPNTIAVGSSGTAMGLFAAKMAQIMTVTFFDVYDDNIHDNIRLEQLSSVLCGMILLSVLSAFTYIDWSGQMGAMLAGFLSGMVLFGCSIKGCCLPFLWTTTGFLTLVAALAAVTYLLIDYTEPDEDIANACDYFRGLFPEGYECGCMW